jgi:hypothetical protein
VSFVGRGGASGALDHERVAAQAADNGRQELWRRSGEELSSGEEVAVAKEPLHGLSRSGSSCGVCLKAKRGTTHTSWSWQHRRKAWQLGRRQRNVEKPGEASAGLGSSGAGVGVARGTA